MTPLPFTMLLDGDVYETFDDKLDAVMFAATFPIPEWNDGIMVAGQAVEVQGPRGQVIYTNF